MNDPDGDCIIFPAQLVKILVSPIQGKMQYEIKKSTWHIVTLSWILTSLKYKKSAKEEPS